MHGLEKITAARPRLADVVYGQILQALQGGLFGASARLHQEKIAKMLDVSRTPVREALLRLEQEGLLVSTTNGGFKVRGISADEVRDIYQTRQAIEGFSAGHLAKLGDQETLRKLRLKISNEEHKTPDTAEDYYEANRIIHRSFVEFTGNAYLVESFDAMWNHSLSAQIFLTLEKPSLIASLGGHQVLCDAIETGDFTTAQSKMQDHIAEGCSMQIAAMEDAKQR